MNNQDGRAHTQRKKIPILFQIRNRWFLQYSHFIGMSIRVKTNSYFYELVLIILVLFDGNTDDVQMMMMVYKIAHTHIQIVYTVGWIHTEQLNTTHTVSWINKF